MSLFEMKYKKLYSLQDKVLHLLSGKLGGFYLTGGTALGRFYLNHRYSEDLYFFTNNSESFTSEVQRIRSIVDAKFIMNDVKIAK